MDIKSLLVRIGADTSELEAKLGKANTYIQKHSAQFRKVGMAMTAAGAAVVGAVGLMVKSYVAAGDEVHKMALRTGFSTEALSELKYAAEISGASLDDIEKGVKKMSKTIVDAEDGLATYVRTFDRIGLSSKDLMKLSPEEQFDKIARAIANVESPTIRAAAAQDIFGRAGTKLLPLFAAGEKGLDTLRQKARDMGIVFDQEAADKAAILNDSLTTLKGSFKGVTMSIATTLVPVITQIVDKISSVAQKIKDWMKEHPKLSGTIMKVAVVLGGLMAVLGPLLVILPSLAAGVTMLGGAFTALLGPLGLVIIAITAVGVAANAVIESYKKKQDAEMDALVEGAKGHAQFWAVRKKLIEDEVVTVDEWAAIYDKHGRNYKRVMHAIATLPEYADIRAALKTQAEDAIDLTEKFENVGIALREAYKPEIIDSVEAFSEALQRQREQLDPLGLKTLEVVEDCNELALAWEQFELESEDTFANVLEGLGFFVRESGELAEKYEEIVKGMTEAQAEFAGLALGEFMAMEASIKGFVDAILGTFEKWAIGQIIPKVMAALPFPANLLATGGAILAIKAVFKKIKGMEEGGYVPKETLAHLHPGEYVLSAPTVKALTGPGLPAAASTSVSHIYLTINAKTLDDNTINRAAEKIYHRLQIEKGRYG